MGRSTILEPSRALHPAKFVEVDSLGTSEPDIWSNSQAPSQVNDTPVFVGLQFTQASRQCIRSRSAHSVGESTAGPGSSSKSFTHCEVSVMRHQPRYCAGMGSDIGPSLGRALPG
jgi:hypothetical protein